MQNGKSLFCMRISHAKRLVYNGMGQRAALAVFKDYQLAADYFVWLVSGGAREINWELFLDMVP